MKFHEALEQLQNKSVDFIFNQNWNGKNQVVKMQTPDNNSKMSQPYLYMETTLSDKCVVRAPWVISQLDLFSDGWGIGCESKIKSYNENKNMDVHDLRKRIDELIFEVEKMSDYKITDEASVELVNQFCAEQRAFELVKVKLQEAKMWSGKVLEAQGSLLPREFRDHCDKRGNND